MERKDLQGLKWCCLLSVKVYVNLKLANDAKVRLKYAQRLQVFKMLYSFKLLFGGSKTQGVDVLAQKSYVKIVKKGLDWLDKDIILEEDVKKNMQLLDQVRQELGIIDIIIYVGTSLAINVPKMLSILC